MSQRKAEKEHFMKLGRIYSCEGRNFGLSFSLVDGNKDWGTRWLFLLLEFIVRKFLRIIYKWLQFWNPIYTIIIQIDSISGYCDDRCTLWLHVSISNQPFSSQLRILSVLYRSTININYYLLHYSFSTRRYTTITNFSNQCS